MQMRVSTVRVADGLRSRLTAELPLPLGCICMNMPSGYVVLVTQPAVVGRTTWSAALYCRPPWCASPSAKSCSRFTVSRLKCVSHVVGLSPRTLHEVAIVRIKIRKCSQTPRKAFAAVTGSVARFQSVSKAIPSQLRIETLGNSLPSGNTIVCS